MGPPKCWRIVRKIRICSYFKESRLVKSYSNLAKKHIHVPCITTLGFSMISWLPLKTMENDQLQGGNITWKLMLGWKFPPGQIVTTFLHVSSGWAIWSTWIVVRSNDPVCRAKNPCQISMPWVQGVKFLSRLFSKYVAWVLKLKVLGFIISLS